MTRKVRCVNKRVYAFDTENDWNEEETEVYFVQCAFVGEDVKHMIFSEGGIVEDRARVLTEMMDIATQKRGCTFFYCANLKHESELLKEGLKIVQEFYDVSYLRRENSMLQISIKIDDNHVLHIRDILLLYPSTSVKSLGELFDIEKLDGFEFKPGWSKEVDFSLRENREYCYRDAEIVYKSAKLLHDNNMDGITISSVAWRKCKEMFNGGNPRNTTMWNRLFPTLTKNIDEICRKAYRGGTNFTNPDFVVKDNTSLVHIDKTSMYPTVGVFDELPYGEPFFNGKLKPEGLYIVVGKWDLELKEKGIDFLQTDLAVKLMDGRYDFHLTSIDYDMMHDNYYVKHEEIDFYLSFSSRVGILKDWFVSWFEKRAIARAKGDTVGDMFAKFMLNSLTGRFGLRREQTECFLEEDWKMTIKTDEEGIGLENTDNYVPYVAFMTAHARRRLIQQSKFFDPLIHMDTDSCVGYMSNDRQILSVVGLMGGWKVEERP